MSIWFQWVVSWRIGEFWRCANCSWRAYRDYSEALTVEFQSTWPDEVLFNTVGLGPEGFWLTWNSGSVFLWTLLQWRIWSVQWHKGAFLYFCGFGEGERATQIEAFKLKNKKERKKWKLLGCYGWGYWSPPDKKTPHNHVRDGAWQVLPHCSCYIEPDDTHHGNFYFLDVCLIHSIVQYTFNMDNKWQGTIIQGSFGLLYCGVWIGKGGDDIFT